MNIGFDLDRVFINYPPFIPPKLIDWLYKDYSKKELSYSIPHSPLAKLIRRSSHIPIFRPKIKQNISFVKNLAQTPSHKLFLISSRYKFLEKLTSQLLQKTGLAQVFQGIYLNSANAQPHLFKEAVIRENRIALYVDDDLALLKHLHKTCPGIRLLWYNPQNRQHDANGITPIHNLADMVKFIK